MLPIAVPRSASGGVTQSQGEGSILGVFFPTDNALYSIAFGTRTKTAEPIGEGQFVLGNLAAHCEVMGHSTMRCAKTAEPIDMPFWMKTQVGPRNHLLDGVQIPKGKGQFLGLSGQHLGIPNRFRNTV